jgi:hypothetical protein
LGSRVIAIESTRSHEPSALATRLDQVEERERNVEAILSEGRRRHLAREPWRPRLGSAGAELAQRLELTLAVHLLGGFGHGREHPADASRPHRFVGHRAVRDLEVRLFEEAFAVDEQGEIVAPGGRFPGKWSFDHRLDDVPDLGPALAPGLAHGSGMLGSGNRNVGVVVELHEPRSPPQEHRKTTPKQQTDRGSECLRPIRNWPDRGARPIDRAHERTHLAAAGEYRTPLGLRHLLLLVLAHADRSCGLVAPARNLGRMIQ